MRSTEAALTSMRTDARSGLDSFCTLLGVGRDCGATVPAEADIRNRFHRIDRVDVSALAADAFVLAGSHHALAVLAAQIPGKSASLRQAWTQLGGEVTGVVTAHGERVDADLVVLRDWAQATVSAASGIEQLLTSWYRVLDRVGEPLVCGVPADGAADAVRVGAVTPSTLADDICARFTLFETAADATDNGITEMLRVLTTATDDLAGGSPAAPPDGSGHLALAGDE